MGGKKVKKEGSEDNEGGAVTLQETAKFSVLDAPGVTQPETEKVEATTAAAACCSISGGGGNKDGMQGRRAVASAGPRMDDSTNKLIGGSSFDKRTKDPEWIQKRLELYNQVAERRAEELKAKKLIPIKVTMPDGKVLEKNKQGEEFMAWKTSPYDVAATISQGLADSVLVARVTYADYVEDYSLAEDGMEGADVMEDELEDDDDRDENEKSVLWDMTRALVGNVAKLELLKFDSDRDAKTAFWHSSAHMLGEALEHLYGSRLTIGPPLKSGFYYDSYMGSDAFNENDCKCTHTPHLLFLSTSFLPRKTK